MTIALTALDPNTRINRQELALSRAQDSLTRAEQRGFAKSPYTSWGELEKAGLTNAWINNRAALSQHDVYKNAQTMARSRIGAQKENLDHMIAKATDMLQYVTHGQGPASINRVDTYAQDALKMIQGCLNASEDGVGVPVFGSFNQTSSPVKVDISNTTSNSIWTADPAAPVPPPPLTAAQKFFQMNITTYTSDSQLDHTVNISDTASVELNVPITSQAFRDLIGAMQIFADSGNPTPQDAMTKGQELLDRAINEMIALRATVSLRLQAIEPAEKEIDQARNRAEEEYQDIFGLSTTEVATELALAQEALSLSHAITTIDHRLPLLIKSLAG